MVQSSTMLHPPVETHNFPQANTHIRPPPKQHCRRCMDASDDIHGI